MKKLLLCSIVLFLARLSMAQNFVPATIEYPNGNLTKAEADFKDWNITPAKVEARQEGKNKTLTPQNIKSVVISDQKYVSATVDLDVSPFRKQSLLYGPERKIVQDTTIFLKVLVEGKPSLLSHLDPSLKQHYFVQLADGRFFELLDIWYYNGDRTHTVHKPIYSGQIKAITVDRCPELLPAAERISYHRKSLFRFFSELNQCQGIAPAYVNLKDDGKFSLIIKGGITLHQLKINEVFSEFSSAKNAKAQEVSPTVGLGIEYTMPWAHERFILGFETYFNFKQHYYVKELPNPDKTQETNPVREKALIEDHPTNNVLRVGLYGKYRLSDNKQNAWFISAGINTDFITLNSTMSYYYHTSTAPDGPTYRPVYMEWYQPNAIVLTGLNASLTKEFGRFLIEGNVYFNQGYTRRDPHNDYEAYLSGISLRTGYKILK